jgi:hypothetical protein
VRPSGRTGGEGETQYLSGHGPVLEQCPLKLLPLPAGRGDHGLGLGGRRIGEGSGGRGGTDSAGHGGGRGAREAGEPGGCGGWGGHDSSGAAHGEVIAGGSAAGTWLGSSCHEGDENALRLVALINLK